MSRGGGSLFIRMLWCLSYQVVDVGWRRFVGFGRLTVVVGSVSVRVTRSRIDDRGSRVLVPILAPGREIRRCVRSETINIILFRIIHLAFLLVYFYIIFAGFLLLLFNQFRLVSFRLHNRRSCFFAPTRIPEVLFIT